MTEELVFYTNPMSRGRIARWMLEEIGQPYRTEYLTFGETMKAPEYLAVNPMGKVLKRSATAIPSSPNARRSAPISPKPFLRRRWRRGRRSAPAITAGCSLPPVLSNRR